MFEAITLAGDAAAPWEQPVLMRASELLDGLGDLSDAIALQCRVLDLIARDHLHQPGQPPTHHHANLPPGAAPESRVLM